MAGCVSGAPPGVSAPKEPAGRSIAPEPAGAVEPAPSRQPAGSAPAPAEKQAEITLDYGNNVYFDRGKTAVGSQGIKTLRKHAKRLKEKPGLRVTLISHTDHLGSRSYNQAISEKRLDAVVKVLRPHGVAKRQIRRIALGYEKPDSAPCRSETCRQALRRVELVYEDSGDR